MNIDLEIVKLAGTIAAVFLSAYALIYTMSFDRRANNCLYYYQKNDRLIELRDKFSDVKHSLDVLIMEIPKLAAEIESGTESDSSTEEKMGSLVDKLFYQNINGRQ